MEQFIPSPIYYIADTPDSYSYNDQGSIWFGQSRGVIDHLLYRDDLKIYGKNEHQVDTCTQTVRGVSSDVCVVFGISKCAALTMNGDSV
jgi:hypothetical protein